MAEEEIIGGGGSGTGGVSPDQAAAGGGTGGAGGEFKWQSHLAETFKDQPEVLKDFTTKGYTDDPAGVQKLAKDFTEAQKVIGQKGITKLPENATDEQKKAWTESVREVLGVPKDVKGYGELPAELDGVKADTKLREGFLAKALDLGLTPDQVKALDAWSFEMTKAASAADAAQNAEFDKAAKARFGNETDAKIKEAQTLIAANISAEFKPLVAGLDNNALLVLTDVLLKQQASLGSEDNGGGPNGGGAGSRSADELHAEKLQLMNSPAYKNAFDPQHKDVTKRVLELNEKVTNLRAAGTKK